MKKYIKLIPILVIAILLFGCGKVSEIVNADLSAALADNVAFSEQLTEIDTGTAENRYMLNSKDYTELTSYIGTMATADEFVIIKTGDVEGVTEKLNAYIERTRKEYETYRPNEVAKLDAAIIEVYKDAVTMIITADTENAVEIYNEYIKK